MPAEYQMPMSQERKPLHMLLPLEQPLSLFIDPCDACNFRCSFCFQSHGDYSGRIMEKELFEKIANDMEKEFANPFKMVHLNGFGEPLLNPHIVDFVKILKEKPIAEKVSITTNASLLNQEKAKELVDAGLDRICISIYALDDEGYLKFSNAKLSFTKLYQNIQFLYHVRGNCHIHIKIAGDYFSEEEKREFIEKFGMVADTVYIDHAINNWPGLKVVEGNRHMYHQSMGGSKICPMPFYQMVIHSNGKVSPCCPEYQQKLVIGDIRRDSLKDIWNGEALRELRKGILKGEATKGKVCSVCEYPESGATVDITPYRQKLLQLY